MNKTITILTSLASMCCFSAFALNIGTVDMASILQNSTQTNQMKTELMTQFGSRNKQLAAQAQTLQADLQSYEKNKTVMAASKLADLKAKLQKEEVALQTAKQQFQHDLAAAQQALSNKMIARLKSSIATIAKQDKIDVVLPSTITLYAAHSTDLTKQVMATLK